MTQEALKQELTQTTHAQCQAIIQAVSKVILGKATQVKLSLACMLAGGHLLIEDLPGMGKTTLAYTLARALGLSFKRVQFTSDLLPADVIGVSVYDRNAGDFKFHPGPIFTEVLLADEINRATPKTQSALLEAMEERQITIDSITRALPAAFFVIATQNPKHHIGTFALPESQLDRFLMRIELGYPDAAAERTLLKNQGGRGTTIQSVCSTDEFTHTQKTVQQIYVSDAIIDYLQALIHYTRANYATGLSPRAGIGLCKCAQAWALMAGRDYVIPEDVQAVLPSIVGHRIQGESEQQVAAQMLSHVPLKNS